MAPHRRPYARFTIALIKLLLGLAIRACYRVRRQGLEHVPTTGAALIVANHVTFIDWLLVAVLCPRPVRFVMHVAYYRLWGLGWFFRWAGAIPIAGRHEDAGVLQAAMDAIDTALAAGEAVVIFPEGSLTRDGEVAAFRPGVEWILSRRPVPVVPVALRGLWGSRFSRARGRVARARLRPELVVVSGERVPAEQATLHTLFERVTGLRGEQR